MDDRWVQISVDVGIGMTLTREGNFWVPYDHGAPIVDGVLVIGYACKQPRLSRDEALAAARDYILTKKIKLDRGAP